MEKLKQAVRQKIKDIQKEMGREELAFGQFIFNNGECQVLTQSAEKVEVLFLEGQSVDEVAIYCEHFGDEIKIDNSLEEWNRYSYAALQLVLHELSILEDVSHLDHIKYTREGMIKRVLNERHQKAINAKYRVELAGNIYGDHIVTNENGEKYKVFLRDFENETGYSNSRDAAINKLGTTKHIMYVFNLLNDNEQLYNKLEKNCPFLEIYLDPLNEYRITWFYPHVLSDELVLFVRKYFGDENFIGDDRLDSLGDFLDEASQLTGVLIRPEVVQKIDWFWEEKSLQVLRDNYQPDFSSIKANLFDYQKEGIQFAATRKSAIIADEMGLGKTIQAIGTALEKKELFGFRRMLVVCPASLKSQWKSEIEKFSNEKAIVVSGFPHERENIYRKSDATFMIVNYETVLRDQIVIKKAGFDFMILDEAQRIKNFETKTAHAIKQLNGKHTLIITGTPIENKLVDLFSLVSVLDDQYLGPLWEFSYQHCLFDAQKLNKINGYYNLQELKRKMESILIRREKRNVIDQLPQVQQQEVRVGLTGLQKDYHASYASALSQIVYKKFLTPYDMKKIQMLLTSMRMVCNSSYLVDETTNDSPKLEELKYILLEKLDIRNTKRKVIIFSEWVKMHKLIGKLLRENNIGFTELNGKVPVAKRGELIKRFETSESCQVFLSTEAGGAGLNLQMADILINFELPWNPAKKNQRIGRIDRIGQRSQHLTIFNFISNGSVEERIALGLLVKQSLFDGVLNDGSLTDFVDFSEKGRSQFLQQITDMVGDLEKNELLADDVAEIEEEKEISVEKNELASVEDDIFVADSSTMGLEKEESVPAEDGQVQKAKQMEQVMTNGMQFLSGLFEMATGNKVDLKDQKIEIDPATGEVTMRFKMPV